MAYGDIKTGEMPLETVIDPLSDKFKKDWDMLLRGEVMSTPIDFDMGTSDVINLTLGWIIKMNIQHSAYDAFAKADMHGKGYSWDFYIKDGASRLVKPFIADGQKIRINSTVHWQLDDCGEYGKSLTATIGDFTVTPIE